MKNTWLINTCKETCEWYFDDSKKVIHHYFHIKKSTYGLLMEEIIWKKEFSVGVTEMDNQHKKLIAMINRLITDQKVLTAPETVANLLTEMIDYAQEHFRAEEYLMSEYGYDRKDSQVAQHEAFIKKTMAFCSASDVGPNILSVALLEYLSTWLIDHILVEDMQYKIFFKNKGVI